MNEIRTGIVAHAAAVKGKGDIAQASSFYAGYSEIDGLRLDVQAILGNPFAMGAKKLVAPRCAVSANDIDFSAGTAHGYRQLLQDVIELGIEMMNLSGAMISEEIVELRDSVWNVLIPSTVHDVKPLARMRVIQTEAIFLRQYSRGCRDCLG
jgi:hypothetical protein